MDEDALSTAANEPSFMNVDEPISATDNESSVNISSAKDFVDDPETHDLDENEFQQIDEEIGSVPEGSVIDVYLGGIQKKLREKVISDDFVKSNFWIHPPSAYSTLSKDKVDPFLLCIPRIFIWLPHKLQIDLRCPVCNKGIEVKGHSNNPKARRIIDLYE